jgi:uncharacterized protein with HEPN domain
MDFSAKMDFETYRHDLKTKSAVERQLQILAEAAIRLGELDGPRFVGPEWKGYCNMGNIIRHAYHRVDDTIIWDTVKKELPVPKAAVQRALTPPPANQNGPAVK